jgi:hypothetical protein
MLRRRQLPRTGTWRSAGGTYANWEVPGERAEGNEAQVLGVIDISGLSAHCKLNYRSQSE